MSPEQRKKFNTVFGSVFLTLGLFGYGMSAYYAVTPNKPLASTVAPSREIVDSSSCVRAMLQLGFQAYVTGPDVEVYAPLPGPNDDVKELLEKASLGIAMCKLKMKEFCMGTTCKEGPGLRFKLSSPQQQAAVVTPPEEGPKTTRPLRPRATAQKGSSPRPAPKAHP